VVFAGKVAMGTKVPVSTFLSILKPDSLLEESFQFRVIFVGDVISSIKFDAADGLPVYMEYTGDEAELPFSSYAVIR